MGCDPFPVILVSFEDLSTDGESVERDRERERDPSSLTGLTNALINISLEETLVTLVTGCLSGYKYDSHLGHDHHRRSTTMLLWQRCKMSNRYLQIYRFIQGQTSQINTYSTHYTYKLTPSVVNK